MAQKTRIFTIGHSNRPIKEFLEMLDLQKLKLLVDVRTIPRSRHNPQFDQKKFVSTLQKHKVSYKHSPGLGGRRRPKKDSVNAAWKSAAFRGYADYMQTPEFEKSLKRLINMSKRKRLVIMCAEAVPWRCHRSLIADALVARDIPVEHLIGKSSPRPHAMTKFARVKHGSVVYP